MEMVVAKEVRNVEAVEKAVESFEDCSQEDECLLAEKIAYLLLQEGFEEEDDWNDQCVNRFV